MLSTSAAKSTVLRSPGRQPTCRGMFARCTCVILTGTSSESPGGLKDFQVELKDGKIFVRASLMIMKAHAVCTLRIENKKTLFVDLESVDVMGVGARNLVQSQLDKINPILDTNDLPVDAELTDYEISDGRLVLHGTIQASFTKS